MSIRLISSDGESLTIERDIALESTFLKNIIERRGSSDEAIRVPEVSSGIFRRVVEWCQHHKGELYSQEEEEEIRISENVDDWDRNFFTVDTLALVQAAHSLQIPNMLALGRRTVANITKGMSQDQFREFFGVKVFRD